MVDRGSGGGGASLFGRSVSETWREDSLAGDPVGYVEKGSGTGISFHSGPVRSVGNLERDASAGDFERW